MRLPFELLDKIAKDIDDVDVMWFFNSILAFKMTQNNMVAKYRKIPKPRMYNLKSEFHSAVLLPINREKKYMLIYDGFSVGTFLDINQSHWGDYNKRKQFYAQMEPRKERNPPDKNTFFSKWFF